MSATPNGWEKISFRQILNRTLGGGTPSRSVGAYFQGTIPWFTVKDLKSQYPNKAEEYITKEAIENSSTNLVPAETLVVATRISLGKAIRPRVDCAINQDLKALFFVDGINPDFILHWFSANERLIKERGSGTTVQGIRLEALNSLPLLLPPSEEQTRIVEKLEELLPQLDAGMAELQAAQKKLTQYRQSLLKAAVEGQLTADWRKKNVPTEDGTQLLERILSERRSHWEAKQLAKFNEQGKKPPKGWQDKYPEPARPDTTNLPELPEGWVWASLDMLGDIVSGVTKGTKSNKKTPTRAVPYLRVANVQRGYLDLNDVKSIEATEKDISELALNDGDVLFNEGGDRDKLGRGWVWRNQIPECIHQNHVFRFRSHSKDISPELISHHGNTFGKLWFQNSGKQTTNLASINITILKGFPIPVSPLDEQRAISDTLRSLLSDLAYQDSAISEAASLIQKQRQNILRAAFAGELVPQDPNDEPASELLARIAAERTAKQVSKRVPAERNKATTVEPSGTKRRKRKEAS